MSRFVAAIGPDAGSDLCRRMRPAAVAAGWTVDDIGPSQWVAVRGAPLARHRLDDGELLLIGDVIPSSGAWSARYNSLETAATDLLHHVWGRYVAVLLDAAGGLFGVFRDPSGALDCALSRIGSTWLIASDTPDWFIDSGVGPPALAWDAVSTALRDPITLSTADLLDGWRTVPPGVFQQADGRRRVLWSPARRARQSEPTEPSALRASVDEAVAGLTRGRAALLVEISGGLDSAIMGASLKAGGFAGPVVWLNTHGPFAESDERLYAAAVADRLGVSLTVRSRSREDLARGLSLDHPRSLRPSLNRLDAVYDAMQAELCEANGAEGVLTGKGGDVAFLQTASSTVLADELRDRGLGALFGGTGPVLARRMRRSAWRVLRAAAAAACRPRAYAPPTNSFLHSDLQGPTRNLHPWLADLEGLGPGKQRQIVGFASHLGLHSLSRRSETAALLHPALSQPVMETVLATPVYRLTRGGHDRLLAREAFADRLPDLLLQRRSKAELGAYYGRVVAAKADALRPHLLEGHLARQGLIDRRQVEAALQVEHLIWQGGYVELMSLALMESWVGVWAS